MCLNKVISLSLSFHCHYTVTVYTYLVQVFKISKHWSLLNFCSFFIKNFHSYEGYDNSRYEMICFHTENNSLTDAV